MEGNNMPLGMDAIKATRPEPFVGLVFYVPSITCWNKVVEIDANKIAINTYSLKGYIIDSNDVWPHSRNYFLEDRYICSPSELWPGELGCPPVPEALWPKITGLGTVHWCNNGTKKWESKYGSTQRHTWFYSIWQPDEGQIEAGAPPTSYIDIKPSQRCPLCHSPGYDLVFAFYCSRKSCSNYHQM